MSLVRECRVGADVELLAGVAVSTFVGGICQSKNLSVEKDVLDGNLGVGVGVGDMRLVPSRYATR